MGVITFFDTGLRGDSKIKGDLGGRPGTQAGLSGVSAHTGALSQGVQGSLGTEILLPHACLFSDPCRVWDSIPHRRKAAIAEAAPGAPASTLSVACESSH